MKSFTSISLVCLTLLLFAGSSYAAQDPLPSWNEGPAKKAILDFVSETTQEGGNNFIEIKDRIATFDEDGTLWVEQPLYTEFYFALDSLKTMAPKLPQWVATEPFKSIILGNLEALKSFSMKDVVQLIAATHTGVTIDEFHQRVANWITNAQHPRFKRPFTDLVYQPMLEVMQFLKDNHFDIYIVSGGGQEFIRAFGENLYGVSPSHVIGTVGKIQYEYRNGNPVLYKLPEVLFVDDKDGKPDSINLFIGKKPVIAFGNSVGDQQMLEWTQGNKTKNLELLVHHDDSVREYAYGPNSKIGTFSAALMDEAKRQGWIVISMKEDWKVIFPWER